MARSYERDDSGAAASSLRLWLRKLGDTFLGGRGLLYAVVAVVGTLVGLSEYEEKTLETKQRVAQEQYAMIVGNLGSDSLVVRVGALGQLPTLLHLEVPQTQGRSHPGEGLMYLLGVHRHPTAFPYHDDLLRVIRALLLVPKGNNEGNELEAEALVSMLCEIGPEGWYNARARAEGPRAEECLSWVWSDAPRPRLFSAASYPLFRGSHLIRPNFSRKLLKRAEFSHSYIRGGDFSDSVLSPSHFANAVLENVSFANADLRYADFTNAVLKGVSFSGASLQYATFSGAFLGEFEEEAVTFDQANLAGADFRGIRTDGVEFDHAINTHLTQGLASLMSSSGEGQ